MSLVHSVAAALLLLVFSSPAAHAQQSTAACGTEIADSGTPSVVRPKPISAAVPKFPIALRNQGVRGEVRLRLLIGCDGAVDTASTSVVTYSDRGFVKSAITAANTSKFTPATIDGRPVPYRLETSVRYLIGHRP
jgi:outer membrane biosynthesis protein TonB